MMEISTKAKERFCKDCNIPLRLFQEPYFTDRLVLYDSFYDTLRKWDIFVKELKKYNCEQNYFEEYNNVKDAAILDIKESEAYKNFNTEDMNKYSVKNKNLPNKDIFKPSNSGKTFISIDMKKANFSSLYHYDKNMFGNEGVNTWEKFISKFTENKHIIESKYIRQVILGNCNPKRHITYEKHIMDEVLTYLIETEKYFQNDKVVFFSNDEIVIDVSDMNRNERENITCKIRVSLFNLDIPFSIELFTLFQIKGTTGYYKKIYNENGSINIEFKCLDNYMLPFVIRKFLGEDIIDNDKVFYHEGLLSKFIEVPNVEVAFDEI